MKTRRTSPPTSAVGSQRGCAGQKKSTPRRKPRNRGGRAGGGGGQGCGPVEKKSTPRRKPTNSGGSPRGDSAPPILATRKMKKTTTCALWRRRGLVRSSGGHQIIAP